MNFEASGNPTNDQQESKSEPKRESSQDIYKGEEGVDWEYGENGFPRKLEKVSEARSLEEITEETQGHQGVIEGTKNDINAVREKLGLPPSDEIPPSVQVEAQAIDRLNDEANSIVNTQDQKSRISETRAETTLVEVQGAKTEQAVSYELKVNQALQEITRGSESLLRTLGERENQALTPLCDPEQLRGIAANFRSLSENQKELTPENIQLATDTVNSIIKLFEGFGAPRGGGVRDSAENLTKLVGATRTLHDSLQEASKKLLSEDGDGAFEDSAQHLREAVKNLDYMSGRLGNYFLKLREVVSGQR